MAAWHLEGVARAPALPKPYLYDPRKHCPRRLWTETSWNASKNVDALVEIHKFLANSAFVDFLENHTRCSSSIESR